MEFLFETIALSVITILLLLLLSTRKAGKIKLILSVLTIASAIASMVLFILLQRSAGNPDAGREVIQLYIPCGIYAVIALWGVIQMALSRRKLRMDKAAKIVAKGKAHSPKADEKQ